MNTDNITAYNFIFSISKAFIAAAFIAALISSTVIFLPSIAVTSVNEPVM